ncbi:MAG: glutamine-hydrolyzing GMP synthase [Planctomycetota bacterium]|nr:glutamine-hydrolyzing GMP synthase [Planctomycetota bacterium]
MHQRVVVVDFGSQYTQLIARRIRELQVYCEIQPPNSRILKKGLIGVVLSGGPKSVYEENAPKLNDEVFSLNVPVLGICYGMQLVCKERGCTVRRADLREYGTATLTGEDEKDLFKDVPKKTTVWMSHGDYVESLSKEFDLLGWSSSSPNAAVRNTSLKFWGVQFHPEVVHTECGNLILKNFLYRICGAKGDWTMHDYSIEAVQKIKETVGDGKVVLGLSGGVDSSVTAVLVNRAVGENLLCVFVDNGLLRKNEAETVVNTFKKRVNLKFIDASERFLAALKGVVEPEKKRRIVGHIFIEVFEEAAKEFGAEFLAQGTLYPDVIESSAGFGGPTSRIKSHHNVGGLPEKLRLKLVEPLRLLLKDEVRLLGRSLGLPEEILNRHPFPGPGLSVRIIGEVTREKLKILREADAIFIEEIRKDGLYDEIWQAFCTLLDTKSVGVKGDERSYEYVLALRAVQSVDGMTADWVRLPYELLERVAQRITRSVDGINRVVYDVTSKPPATIEWE